MYHIITMAHGKEIGMAINLTLRRAPKRLFLTKATGHCGFTDLRGVYKAYERLSPTAFARLLKKINPQSKNPVFVTLFFRNERGYCNRSSVGTTVRARIRALYRHGRCKGGHLALINFKWSWRQDCSTRQRTFLIPLQTLIQTMDDREKQEAYTFNPGRFPHNLGGSEFLWVTNIFPHRFASSW
ncbi:MAG: hypothetical protein KBC26_03540 [Candidatus Pacebacteria bacterium]|nr:hypothetical protein [Candidatus Paceibacterota bacterium]